MEFVLGSVRIGVLPRVEEGWVWSGSSLACALEKIAEDIVSKKSPSLIA